MEEHLRGKVRGQRMAYQCDNLHEAPKGEEDAEQHCCDNESRVLGSIMLFSSSLMVDCRVCEIEAMAG
jgi:hypothetical protein